MAHVTVFFVANFIKNKFGGETEKVIETILKEEQIKVFETNKTVVKEENTKGIMELSRSLILLKKRQNRLLKSEDKKKDMKRI